MATTTEEYVAQFVTILDAFRKGFDENRMALAATDLDTKDCLYEYSEFGFPNVHCMIGYLIEEGILYLPKDVNAGDIISVDHGKTIDPVIMVFLYLVQRWQDALMVSIGPGVSAKHNAIDGIRRINDYLKLPSQGEKTNGNA